MLLSLPAAQQVPVVRHVEQLNEPQAARNDGVLVPLGVRAKKVRLDLFHVARGGHAGNLVNFAAKVEQGGRQHDQPRVGLEVNAVDFVKAQQRAKESNVGVREHVVARQVALRLENVVGAIKGFAEFGDRLVVGTLVLGESAPVDSVNHERRQPVADLVEFGHALFVRLGIQIELGETRKFVKGGIQHVRNVARLVVDNGALLLVPEQGNGVFAARVARVLVDFPNTVRSKHGIGLVALVGGRKGPSALNRVGKGLAVGIAKDPAAVFVVFAVVRDWSNARWGARR